MTAENQRANIRVAAEKIALVAPGNEIVVAHGNGPQVGLLSLQAAAYAAVAPYPLDVLGAQTEAMIGYVARKVTILARACGVEVEVESVPVESLVPESLQDWTPSAGEVLADAFIEQMRAYDDEKTALIEKADAAGGRENPSPRAVSGVLLP